MKRTTTAVLTFLLLVPPVELLAAKARFEKVTDHFYWLQLQADGPGVGAVVTDGGVLLVNPPAQPQLTDVLGALKAVTSKPPNWVVNTDYSYERDGGSNELAQQGASILESKALRHLAGRKVETPALPAGSKDKEGTSDGKARETAQRLVFDRQVRVFPDNLEVRVFALQSPAHTGGDVVVFIPAEKVLIVGDLFASGSYPVIDREPGGGSGLGWLDGMKQAIDAVPLLKSTMPQPKPDPTKPPPEEKTLAELIVVQPGHGPRSNLQEMKDMLEVTQKLVSEVSRAVSRGRSRDVLTAWPAASPYRAYSNLDAFVAVVSDELIARKVK